MDASLSGEQKDGSTWNRLGVDLNGAHTSVSSLEIWGLALAWALMAMTKVLSARRELEVLMIHTMVEDVR